MTHRDRWADGGRAWADLAGWARDGGDALGALHDIGEVRRLLDETELEAVRAARRQGKSWAEIAIKLGITRQSAWERWRDLDTEPAGAVEQMGLAEELMAGKGRGRAMRRRETAVVPLVIGLPVDDARTALAEHHLLGVSADLDGPPLSELATRGFVVSEQSVRPGARVARGTEVRLWTERGGGAGVREPRRPQPTAPTGRKMRDLPVEDAS